MFSIWRVSSGFHTYGQTAAGFLIGLMFGRLTCFLEKLILFQKFSQSNHFFINILADVTSRDVPLFLRILVCIFGTVVFYNREIFDFEKVLYKMQKRK
jgi:hypothetical protein